jgi:hypothetical protein
MPEHIFIGEAEFPKDAHDIRELFEEYAAWLARHDVPWSLQRTAECHDWIQELATLPGKYAPPSGRLLLVRCDNAAVGGASNREGKAIGYSSMRLDTVPKAMPVADALHRNLGREIAGDRFPVNA